MVASLPILVTSPAKTNYSIKIYILWIGFSDFRIGEPNIFLLLLLKFNCDKYDHLFNNNVQSDWDFKAELR